VEEEKLVRGRSWRGRARERREGFGATSLVSCSQFKDWRRERGREAETKGMMEPEKKTVVFA
jgi:hypothetical protein